MRAAIAMLALLGTGASTLDPPAWSEPTAAFPILGPIHYVGTKGLAAYLIKTRDGAILIDATLEQNVAAIERNIASVGVPIHGVKILLNSHAHFDHAAGLAQLQRDSGARLAVMDGDARAIATGRPPSVVSYGLVTFPAARVDRELHDGDTVTLGGITLTAIKTPGHTAGCTTWTMPVRERGRTLVVMFPCSLTVAGNQLVGNPGYPGIVTDFRSSFARLATMTADVLLPAHPELADVMAHRAQVVAGRRDAFVDPGALGRMVAVAREAFDRELIRQQTIAQR
ncbi:subclass B3 metallo-beta-lactamase [Sphingomonas oligophenolica]|uniref:Subclass B3 metallo-beta-lactamase n=1 Tax=Sphingomonas oligophenolica TaxID=301154 RepID=A0A502CK07_9SPHN|nr:subclass B3 metallo-beta-lactamase [Sphingomonas oligophenolica]TPG13072.1 subclass B3 metallo-beta-lactamase [Sphingomonas oligophenolica]